VRLGSSGSEAQPPAQPLASSPQSPFLAGHSGSKVAGRDGWWRTLEERANDPAFQEHLYNEFPSQIEAITDPVARRTFLKLMGASMALAGVTACTRQPTEKIVPFVRQPEELVRAGYDAGNALILAGHAEVDLHAARRLLERGCPPETALRIIL